MKALITHVRFFHGYSITHPGETSAKEPMIYPPPTTLIGALAAAEAKSKGRPEVIEYQGIKASYALNLLNKVLWAAPAILKNTAIPYRTMIKSLSIPYLRKKNRTLEMALSPTITGWIVYDNDALLLYLIKKDDDAEELAKYAWGITSVGSKESLVEVLNVRTSNVEAITAAQGTLKTPFPTPELCLTSSPRHASKTTFIDPTKEAYLQGKNAETSIWYVPYNKGAYGGFMKIEPGTINTSECTAIKFPSPLNAEEIIVIAPNNALSG